MDASTEGSADESAADALPAENPDAVDPSSGRGDGSEPAGVPQAFGREWVGLIAVTVALDYLLYQGPGGLSIGICFLVLPFIVTLSAWRRVVSSTVVVLGCCLVALATRCAWQQNVLAIVLGAGAVVSYAAALKFGRHDVPFLARAILPTVLFGGARLVEYVRSLRRMQASLPRKNINPVLLRTIGIPVLITGAFALVFVAANTIMQQMASNLWPHLERFLSDYLAPFFERVSPSPERLLFWFACLWLAAGLLRPKRLELGPGPFMPPQERKEPSDDGIHFQVSLNTLIAVNLLFLAYNALDARYLIGEIRLPEGLDHSQYARQGAFWLTVALALSTFVLGALFREGIRKHARGNVLFSLALVWIVQNFALCLWVIRRLGIYIDYNGLTRMRIVGVMGTLLVIVGFTLVVVKVKGDRSLTWLVRRQLSAFFLALVLVSVLPLDLIVWGVNVPLMMRDPTSRIAVQLSVQPISSEGVPLLIPLLDHEDPVVARGAAAVMGDWYFRHRRDETARDGRWSEYQAASEWARKRVAEEEQEILRLVPQKNWSLHMEALRRHTARWI